MSNTPKNDTRVVSRNHIPPPLRDGVPLDAGVADLVHGFHFPVAVSDSVSKRYIRVVDGCAWSGGDLPEILWAALCVIRGTPDPVTAALFAVTINADTARPFRVVLKIQSEFDADGRPLLRIVDPMDDRTARPRWHFWGASLRPCLSLDRVEDDSRKKLLIHKTHHCTECYRRSSGLA